MASEIRVYFEGDPKLRRGFDGFFRKLAIPDGVRVKPIGCGQRVRALKSFARALSDHPEAFNVLLVDAEGAVDTKKPWDHLRSLQEEKLAKPRGASDAQAHLMVQVMESWFLADVQTLQSFYGQDFLTSRIPARSDVECVPKAQVLQALGEATEKTKKKRYHKTVHAPELLATIDPDKVRRASTWCERLCTTIEKVAEL